MIRDNYELGDILRDKYGHLWVITKVIPNTGIFVNLLEEYIRGYIIPYRSAYYDWFNIDLEFLGKRMVEKNNGEDNI